MIESIFFNPWIWIVPVILIVLLVLAVLSFAAYMEGVAILLFFCALILAAFYFGLILPPYDGTYYQTYRVTGELVTLESAFSGDEGTMSQVFVAEVDGVDYLIRSDDQRFRTLDVGDDVRLACTKQFEYFVEPWLECRFG